MGAALLALSACEPGAGFGTSRAVPVLGGAVNVGLPAGYCVNRSAGREGKGTAVVVMGRCSAGAGVPAALVTVTVGGGGSSGVMTAGPAGLAQFFASPAGRATLARSGRPGDIRILGALSSGNAFLLHLSDRGLGEYWRAITGIRGRLVTVSAVGTPGVPLDPAEGRRLIDKLLAGLAAANPG